VSTKNLKVDLPAEIFDVAVNIPLIHQVVVAQRAAARQGTHSTKTRGEVRGGGRKPHKQKGTGRARQGSTRSPQFAGGGVAHGPQPRSYDQRTPKKMKAAALRGALSDRARNDRVHVVESLVGGDKPSTKAALAALTSLADRSRFLVVLERADAVTWLSLRNAGEVHIVAVDQLNTYDVLASDDVVFTKGAFDTFVSRAARGTATGDEPAAESKAEKPKAEKPKAATAEEPEADEPRGDEPVAFAAFAATADDDVPGGAVPGPDGAAPEGYLVKGNKDSMKYHAPGGRWYDATIAEVWFKTEADAEAAGFVKAGSRASKAANEEADK
jgi:large subunit ribosomal protein L4